MKMTIQAKLKEMHRDGAKIGVSIHDDFEDDILIPEFYTAMLNAMRDTHEHEFYVAMSAFIEEEIGEMEG